jgi:protein-tyrosine-phosphatase
MLKEKNLDIKISSAGINALLGLKLLENTKKVLEMNNIFIEDHSPLQVEANMVRESDLILTMTRFHKETLMKNYPESLYKIYLLSEYADSKGVDIIDPFGSSIEVYKECFLEIKKYLEKLLERLMSEEKE